MLAGVNTLPAGGLQVFGLALCIAICARAHAACVGTVRLVSRGLQRVFLQRAAFQHCSLSLSRPLSVCSTLAFVGGLLCFCC